MIKTIAMHKKWSMQIGAVGQRGRSAWQEPAPCSLKAPNGTLVEE